MAKNILYIACSIDQYIADKDYSISWLDSFNSTDPELDYGYFDFIKGIDNVVFGRKSYQDVLAFGVDWPYADQKTFVLSSDKNFSSSTPNTLVIDKIEMDFLNNLQGNTWVVGGSGVVSEFMKLSALHEIKLFVMPVFLGSGVRLFLPDFGKSAYKLIDSRIYKNGVVYLNYLKD